MRAEGALYSAIMSTGRICPCQKKDNSKKIANLSVWHNPGEFCIVRESNAAILIFNVGYFHNVMINFSKIDFSLQHME